MMRVKIFGEWLPGLLGTVAALALLASCSPGAAQRSSAPLPPKTLLDAGWLFHRDEVADSNAVSSIGYDDHSWQAVDLPHDYVLDGTYDPKGDRGHGYLPITTAWYRHHFVIPMADQGKSLELQFDGVFSDSQVWLNGQYLGEHRSGYTGFAYDIGSVVRYGAENVITVHVDPRHLEGWWYEGGGIYRHVWLNARAPVHVANDGTQVVSEVPGGSEGADAEADVTLHTTVTNCAAAAANCIVASEIVTPDGTVLPALRTAAIVAGGGQTAVVQTTVLPHPQLWSPETPRLYQLRTTVWRVGRPVDATTTTFGIRTIRFDADKGFFLNGKHVEIHGLACHQDFPAAGIAVPDSLQEWRVRQLQKSGANGWRTAHNPPTEAVLDACDRLGMLVMDENRHLGNTHRHHSLPGTTFTNADDLAFMIQRDRNHPSIIMWSLCNEEPLQGTREGARIFSAMMKTVHEYDRTRPITCAMHAGWLKPGIADVEDLIGVNYGYDSYDAIHKAHPHTPMFGSEMGNNKTARGVYADDRTNGWLSNYHLTDPLWQAIAVWPFMAGCYLWTGFDYRGEPNPNGWPDISNNTGLVDTCGFPKDKFYYLKSWWSAEPMVHLLPVCWNWPGREGQNIRVIAFSNARQIELFLNDQSLGIQTMPPNGHLEWQVPYAPGRLVAKGSTDGRLLAADMVETVDAPAGIKLSPDRQTLQADGSDTVVVPVSIVDAQGRFVANASNRMTFQLTGGGRLLGVGTGNPSNHDPDRASQRNAFNGHCLALIQAGREPATLELTATSPGLAPATVTFQVR
jgi:beta-galactosidase